MSARAGRSKKTQPDARQPFYVIAGKDRRRAVDTLHRLVEQLLGDADEQLALSQYDGKEASLSDVLTDLQTMPFLSDVRIVVVKDADDFITRHRQALETYQKTPSATGVLVLQAESFAKSTRLYKALNAAGAVIDCSPVGGRDLPKYLSGYAKDTYGLELPVAVARYLIETAGDDSGILCGEIDKFAAYLADPASPGKRITQEVVERLSGHNRQYNVFNVIDLMVSGQTAQALERLDAMMRMDRDAEYGAVGAFAWHVRRLYRARVLLDDRVSEREIPKKAGVWRDGGGFMRQVKQLKIRDIARALKKLAEIDRNQKTGAGTVKDGLEKFIVEFSGRRVR